MINNNVCNNCGKSGHLFNQCKLPIISYGIILFRSSSRGIEYLMIRRKNSFGYIDFIRGKYSPYNIHFIQNIIDEMSIVEKNMILTDTFDNLWKQMWGNIQSSQFKNEENISNKKMEVLKNGIFINDNIITLKDIIDKSTTNWFETEWEFPKGRRNGKEKDIDCAKREFEEETGIPQNKIKVIENILPFEEIFIGSNHKSYKHKYFLAYMDENEELLDNFQISEVSKLE
jgi:ADP-ribose pyrophosphatase YjhB (NUDIX family)